MPLSAAELLRLQKAPTSELRELAAKQLQQGQQALAAGKAATNDVSWYQQPLRVSQYVRWRPETDALEEAEKTLKAGDAEKDEATKRARYIECYRAAYLTAESIAKEAKLPPTNFTTAVWNEAAAPIKQALEGLGKSIESPLGNLTNAATVAAVVWLVYKLVKK